MQFFLSRITAFALGCAVNVLIDAVFAELLPTVAIVKDTHCV